MAEYYKTPDSKLNDIFYDYFYLNHLYNYDELLIIDNDDFNKLDINLDNLVIVDNKDIDNYVNDNNPIYLNIKLINNAKIIYLKEHIDILNDNNIKTLITSFRGKIICNYKLCNYLKNLNLIKEEYKVNKNTYLKIDKYGKVEYINIL